MMMNWYWVEAWTPSCAMVAMVKGRMYKEAPSEWGTQSFSTSTMAFTA